MERVTLGLLVAAFLRKALVEKAALAKPSKAAVMDASDDAVETLPYLLSRSRSSKRGPRPSGVALRSCCATQALAPRRRHDAEVKFRRISVAVDKTGTAVAALEPLGGVRGV
jgi:hypothetical protein